VVSIRERILATDLYESGDAWTTDAMSRRLRVRREQVQSCMSQLVERGEVRVGMNESGHKKYWKPSNRALTLRQHTDDELELDAEWLKGLRR
jgi:hypothetical protein